MDRPVTLVILSLRADAVWQVAHRARRAQRGRARQHLGLQHQAKPLLGTHTPTKSILWVLWYSYHKNQTLHQFILFLFISVLILLTETNIHKWAKVKLLLLFYFIAPWFISQPKYVLLNNFPIPKNYYLLCITEILIFWIHIALCCRHLHLR